MLFFDLDYHENLRYLFVGNLALYCYLLYYSWDSRLCVHTCMHACVCIWWQICVCSHNITATIISNVQILKKSSVLYKEHDGRWGSWLMHLYKNKAKIKHIPLVTHTHTHTYTFQIKQGWVSLSDAGWRNDLQSRLESRDCCSISNVWWYTGREFQTEGPKWEKVWSPFPLVLI